MRDVVSAFRVHRAYSRPTAFAEWQRNVVRRRKGAVYRFATAPILFAYFQGRSMPAAQHLTLWSGALECTWVGKPLPTAEERKSWAGTRADLALRSAKIGKFTIFDLVVFEEEIDFYPGNFESEIRSGQRRPSDQYREINVHVRSEAHVSG